MKKLLLLLILIAGISFISSAQFNPVSNLDWQHTYDYPNNYFTLSWDMPAASSDTLVGFNIYRNDSLYRFQTDSILIHQPMGGDNCPESFLFFDGGSDFWIHVTAVYNTAHYESVYNDSAHCMGIALGVEDYEIAASVFPNPSHGLVNISTTPVDRVRVFDPTGKLLLTEKNTCKLDLSEYPGGTYLLMINKDDQLVFVKAMIY